MWAWLVGQEYVLFVGVELVDKREQSRALILIDKLVDRITTFDDIGLRDPSRRYGNLNQKFLFKLDLFQEFYVSWCFLLVCRVIVSVSIYTLMIKSEITFVVQYAVFKSVFSIQCWALFSSGYNLSISSAWDSLFFPARDRHRFKSLKN